MISFHIIYKIITIPVFWTDRFLKDWQGGLSCGFFCIIRPKYKADKGILEHELTHCKQFYRTFGMHGLFYKFSPEYRLFAEVEAYKKQLEFYPDKEKSIEWVAEFIATRYDLKVTANQVKLLLV